MDPSIKRALSTIIVSALALIAIIILLAIILGGRP